LTGTRSIVLAGAMMKNDQKEGYEKKFGREKFAFGFNY
jgi:hypothetical protein